MTLFLWTGRLQFSAVEGKDGNGKYERFYTFGTRGFSIWRVSDMEQVFDSGSDMEQKTAELRPDIFNADVLYALYEDHSESADRESDKKVMKFSLSLPLCLSVCLSVCLCLSLSLSLFF